MMPLSAIKSGHHFSMKLPSWNILTYLVDVIIGQSLNAGGVRAAEVPGGGPHAVWLRQEAPQLRGIHQLDPEVARTGHHSH